MRRDDDRKAANYWVACARDSILPYIAMMRLYKRLINREHFANGFFNIMSGIFRIMLSEPECLRMHPGIKRQQPY